MGQLSGRDQRDESGKERGWRSRDRSISPGSLTLSRVRGEDESWDPPKDIERLIFEGRYRQVRRLTVERTRLDDEPRDGYGRRGRYDRRTDEKSLCEVRAPETCTTKETVLTRGREEVLSRSLSRMDPSRFYLGEGEKRGFGKYKEIS